MKGSLDHKIQILRRMQFGKGLNIQNISQSTRYNVLNEELEPDQKYLFRRSPSNRTLFYKVEPYSRLSHVAKRDVPSNLFDRLQPEKKRIKKKKKKKKMKAVRHMRFVRKEPTKKDIDKIFEVNKPLKKIKRLREEDRLALPSRRGSKAGFTRDKPVDKEIRKIRKKIEGSGMCGGSRSRSRFRERSMRFLLK